MNSLEERIVAHVLAAHGEEAGRPRVGSTRQRLPRFDRFAPAVHTLGSILVGRIFSHPHASRYGAMGVAVVVMVAIAYTVILVILDSITGSGCT